MADFRKWGGLFRLVVVALILAAAALAQSAPATFETYKPAFSQDVFIVNEAMHQANYPGWKVGVNPFYALSDASAFELLEVMKDYQPVMFYAGPFGWGQSGGFKSTRLVPWFKFPDGSAMNAGLLAQYFAHGFSLAWVKFCIGEEMAWLRKQVEANGSDNFAAIPGYPR